ncbi:hypothetical protein LCGC14_1676750, partial [marine sediment metagenome]
SLTILNNMSNDIEKKYLEIINNLDIGFFKGEFKGKLLMHNRTLNKILGIDPSKDLTGTSAIQFFYNPEDHEKYNEELMKNGHIRNLITKIKKINGDIIIVEINAHIVKNVDREQLTVEGTVIDRTEKYQIEQKLKDFEVKFKLILDNSTDLIAFLNKKFVHEFINENAYLKVLGYSREDIIGKRATDFIHPEDMIRISKTLKKGFLKGKFSDEHRVKHKNGHYIWVETKGNFIKDNGQIKGLIYISRVINKRKEAEEELKKFKSILDNANYGVGIINRGGNFAYLNDYFAEIHGYKTNELIGKNLTIFHNDAQLERVMDLKKKLEEEGSYNAEEVWHKHKDGSVFPMLMNGITINDDKGNPLFMASTTIDITELKKAEQKLKEFERIKIPYFEAIESLGEVKKYIEKVLRDGAYLFETKHQTKDGKIKDILVNGQAISIHGKKYIQSIFRDITDIKKTERQSKESKEKFSYRHNISIILGLVFSAIYLIIEGLIDNFIFRNTEFLFQDIFTTDPHEILMHLIPISLILFSGIFSQYLINAQRKAEDKLKESEARYHEAFDRTTFYKDLLTHDMNNILQGIQLTVEISSLEENISKKLKESLESIKNQVLRGAKLVSNVHKLSQLEESQKSLQNIDMCNVLKDSLNFLKKSYKMKKINVKVETHRKSYLVKANNILREVYENILSNAVKYNENSTIEILIRFSEEQKEEINYIKMEFMDNGRGIPDSKKKIIFSRGFLEEKQSGNHGGLF